MTQQEKINNCFGKEDHDKSIACISEVVRSSSQDKCPLSLVLLTQKSCEVCDDAKATYKKGINDGTIQVLDIGADARALKIAAKNEISAMPSLLLLDCNDMVILPSD